MSSNPMVKALIILSYAISFLINAQSIYQEPMFRLNGQDQSTPQVQTLAKYQGQPFIASFFMPNCPWCQRQHKVLKKIQPNCPQVKTIMLGVKGSKQKLRQSLNRKQNTFPAYLASNNIVNALGAESPVPMMLFFDSQGKLVFKTVGFTPEKKITNLLKILNLSRCLTPPH